MRSLDVYFGAHFAGRLVQDDGGLLTYAYASDYLADSAAWAISVSMPLTPDRFEDRVVRPYFSGLLPDEDARRRLAAALGMSAANAFGLLEIIGGDCAGALSLYPMGATPPSPVEGQMDWLDDARLAAIMRELRERPLLGGEHGVRLSLAGAQDKLAVCADERRIGLAQNGQPTTHILKLQIPALEGMVENELFCLRLAARMGLPAARAERRTADGAPILLVQRHDRKMGQETPRPAQQATHGMQRELKRERVLRLHQEDFCQALGVPPEIKYEQEGGPGAAQSLALIARVCAQPARERLGFIRRLIFQYLVGNADAHAKNYALLYRHAAPDLAPLYDVLCTAVYPRLHKPLAMRIGKRSMPDAIRLEDWATLVPPSRTALRLLVKDLRDMAARIGTQADDLRGDLAAAGIEHPVLGRIRKVIESRRRHLLRISEGQ